jgi:glucose-1-phosphate adenylyltransferase
MSIMSQTLTLILAGERPNGLSPIMPGKPKALLPFGGVFCILDFTISNCVNSEIERAYLLTQYKSDLIRRYVESSLWRTDTVCVSPRTLNGYHGTADWLYQNLDLIRACDKQYVLVLPADHIYKMNYSRLVRFHASHGGEATIAGIERPKTLASIGVCVFSTSALHKALLRQAGYFGNHDVEKDVVRELIPSDRVFAYDFGADDSRVGSYWRSVDTIDAYHRAQMEMLAMNSPSDAYQDARWPIYAGGRPAASCILADPRRSVLDSIISQDSDISGATVLQSVISPSVTLAAGAHIEKSVLLRGARVGRGARIRRAIVCEGVEIPDGARIGFDPREDHGRFLVTENGVVVVRSTTVDRVQKQPIKRLEFCHTLKKDQRGQIQAR